MIRYFIPHSKYEERRLKLVWVKTGSTREKDIVASKTIVRGNITHLNRLVNGQVCESERNYNKLQELINFYTKND